MAIELYRFPQPVVTITPVAGGSLVAGTTYYYRVQPWRGPAYPSTASSYDQQNGPASVEVSFTADATYKSCTLTITNPDTQARAWHIFRTTTSGSYPATTHLAIKTTTAIASDTYTDTGIATAALANSYADTLDIDLPAINVKAYYKTISSPATGIVAGSYTLSGFSGGSALTPGELDGRIAYFATDKARFKNETTDPNGEPELRYARIRYNNASTIVFETYFTVVPDTGDLIRISWNEEDIYQASIAGAGWGTISASHPYPEAGQPIVVKNGPENYRINATLNPNNFNDVNDFCMFSFSPNTIIDFGTLCRFIPYNNSAIYIGNCNSDEGSGSGCTIRMRGTTSSADTIQNGFQVYGHHDITGLRYQFKSPIQGQTFGNDSIQVVLGQVARPYSMGCNRCSGCTFDNVRATQPGMLTVFRNNNFFDGAAGFESSYNEMNGATIVNSKSNALRLNGNLEQRQYNTTVIGGQGNAYDMWQNDTNANYTVNPAPSTVAKMTGTLIGNSVHWESTPNAGTLWIQYQLGFKFSDASTGNALQDVCVEVLDKDGNPIYTDILERFKPGYIFESRNVFNTVSSVRNIRGVMFPIVKVTEFIPAIYLHGRYYSGTQNTALKVRVAEKGEAQGQMSTTNTTPVLNISAQTNTGYTNVDEGEQTLTIDPTKMYLMHAFGDMRYVGTLMMVNGLSSYPGAGVKTTTTDETDYELAAGYTSPRYSMWSALYARRFYSDANGRIPLLDFNAMSFKKGPTHVYTDTIQTTFTPWTIRITKDGYETVEFKLTPSGLYEKEFVVALKPQIPKLEDDNGNVFDRVDKTNSGTTNLRRKLVKV